MWAVLRFFHDPEGTHWKAARKILEYLRAADLLGLSFQRDIKLNEYEFDLDACVDAVYSGKATGRRSVSGAAIFCDNSVVGSRFLRTYTCVTSSTSEAKYAAMGNGVKEAYWSRKGVSTFLVSVLDSPSI